MTTARRCGAVLLNLALSLALSLALLGAPLLAPAPAFAQAPAAAPTGAPAAGMSAAEAEDLRRARNSMALFYYGSRYTVHVLGGIVAGGYLFALLSWGRTGSTVFGSVLGASVGIWWFLNDFAADVLDRHSW